MSKISIIAFLVLLLLGITKMASGQENEKDSLTVLLESNIADSVKINTLFQLTVDNLASEPNKALQYCEMLYQISDSLDNQQGIIDAMSLKSKIYSSIGEIDTAIILGERVIQLCDSLNELDRLASATFKQAMLLYYPKGPKKANELFQKSYQAYALIPDSYGMANSLNAIGVTYFGISKYALAVNYLLKAVKIAERDSFPEIVGKAYSNLGMVYSELKEFTKAKQSLKRSIEVYKSLDLTEKLGNPIHNLGNIYIQEENFDSAWIVYNKELELSLGTDNPGGVANAYTGLGDVYLCRRKYDKAYVSFSKALANYQSVPDQQGILISYKNLGLIEERRGNYKSARLIYDSCLIMAQDWGLLKRQVEIYENICDNYAATGDFQNAYHNYQAMVRLQDTIMNIEKRETIASLELDYEVEKKKAQIFELQNENLNKDLDLEQRTRQRNTYLFSGMGVVLVLVFLFSYYSQRSRKNQIIAEQRINQLEEEKKLLAARSIVEGQEDERKRIAKELHDGLGVLLSSAKMHFTTIRDRSTENKSLMDKAAKLLEQATGDVRRISHNMMPGLLTKYGLYEAIEDLFEQMDDIKGLKAKINIQGEQTRLPENTEIMLYRIIQEMANNSLKHAKAKTIELMVSIGLDKLTFQYADDGIGFDLAEKLKSKSMGLTSIQSRVKFLGGEVKVQSEPEKGVTYDFEIPLNI